MRSTCPECSEEGEIVDRERTDSGMRSQFECSNCDHAWTVEF